MAVLLQCSVSPATHEQFDELDVRVGQSMSVGGPPAGLMSHVVYADGDGFMLAQVWRTDAEGQAYLDGALRPLMTELGLAPQDTTIRPVWSFARP
jgi:hypothetical protein